MKSPVGYNQFYQLYEAQLRRSAQFSGVITDVNNRIAKVNQLLLTRYGCNADKVRRTPLSELFPVIGKSFSEKEVPVQLAMNQGGWKNYNFELTPVSDKRSGITGQISMLSESPDVAKVIGEETSRNLTEASADEVLMSDVKKKQVFLSKLIESRDELIWSIDRKHKYTYFNQHFAKIISRAYGIDPLIGNSVFKNVPAEVAEAWKPFYALSLNGETNFFRQPFVINGMEIFYEFCLEPLLDDEGIISGVSIIGRDISVQHNLKRLQKAREDAEPTNIVKTEFLATINHELRTPLNGIIGYTNLVLDTPLNELQLEYLNIVKSSSESLLRMMNDLRDISKIESGKMELLEEEFNLQELFRDIIHPLMIKAHKRNNAILLTYDVNLPAFAICDKRKLEQIIINLIENALRLSENSIINVRVQKKSEENSRVNMHVEVQDHGKGMQPEEIEEIFEPARQGDFLLLRKYGSPGLVLSISKKLLQLMHSDLSVKSTFGLGSTFYFTVPIKVPLPLEEESTDPIKVPSSPEEKFIVPIKVPPPFKEKKEVIHSVDMNKTDNKPEKKYRILLAEDNEINQLLTERLLQMQGYETTTVGNGVLALEKFGSQEFDLLLIDIQMPEMDGMEFIKRIREKEKLTNTHVPILVLTAHVMPDDLRSFIESGADGCITKPVMIDQLRNAIQKALHIRT